MKISEFEKLKKTIESSTTQEHLGVCLQMILNNESSLDINEVQELKKIYESKLNEIKNI